MNRKLKVTDIHRGRGSVVPELRLRGKWLQRAGFPRGTQVHVLQNADGSITITPIH